MENEICLHFERGKEMEGEGVGGQKGDSREKR